MADLSTEQISFEQALANLLLLYGVGAGSGTIVADRLSLINAVKAKLDEIIPEGEGVQFAVDGDTNISDPMNLLINAILDEAAKRVLLNAPIHVLDPVKFDGDAVPDKKDNKTGYIVLPDNYLRFVTLKMVDWDRPVVELLTPIDKRFKLQFNRFTRGGLSKPQAAIVHYAAQVDYYKPVITLIGDSVINMFVDGEVIDAGATAYDHADGDITADIVVTGVVNNNVAGTYYKRYNVTDSAGNTADEVTRTYVITSQT